MGACASYENCAVSKKATCPDELESFESPEDDGVAIRNPGNLVKEERHNSKETVSTAASETDVRSNSEDMCALCGVGSSVGCKGADTFPVHSTEGDGCYDKCFPKHLAASVWLGVSPPAASPVSAMLQKCFPGAVPGFVFMRRINVLLRPFGLTPENTLYGQSFCPDEINGEKGDLADLLQDHWGECFPMGGIGGAPYVGKTGFMAFSHHVPEDGHVLVAFGPHIAISQTGELGKCRRDGQEKESGACGALLAAYAACKAGKCRDEVDPYDLQQCWLEKRIMEDLEDINSAEEPISQLTKKAYAAVKNNMLNITNTKYGNGNLVLIGGIQINMPAPYADHFQPLFLQVRAEGKEPIDLLPGFFADDKVEDVLAGTRSASLVPTEKRRKSVGEREAIDNPCNQAFAWLGLTPNVCAPSFRTLHEHFPGALPGRVLHRRSLLALEKYGLNPANTLYGNSICPDEINNEKGTLSTIMKDHWGECFPMGGIGGAPYVGKTGFMAFSHHVPDNGNVLVLFGPHIAISEYGELGKYLRIGQSSHSGACGAVLAAYASTQEKSEQSLDEYDMEQGWLKQVVSKRRDEIDKNEAPLAALTRVAYDAVRDKMLAIVNHNYGSGKLVLIGGIQINMPEPYVDHFQPLIFNVSSKDIPDGIDMLSAFACMSSVTG